MWAKIVKLQLKHFEYQLQMSGFQSGVLPMHHGKR